MNFVDEPLTEDQVNQFLKCVPLDLKMINGDLFCVHPASGNFEESYDPFYDGNPFFNQFSFRTLRGILYYIHKSNEDSLIDLEKQVEELEKQVKELEIKNRKQ